MEILPKIGVYMPLLPALLALWYWKKLSRNEQRFGVMLWAIAVISIAGRVWTLSGHTNNLPFFHVYILVEGLFLLILFRQILGFSIARWVWKFVSIAFVLSWFLQVILGAGWFAYPSTIHGLEALLILSLVAIWFFKIMREKVVRNILQTFEFWLCTGLLLFFSTNLLFFLFSTFIAEQSSLVFKTIWGVHALLAILLYVIYSYAIICAVKTPK